jgi:hypothetical protein
MTYEQDQKQNKQLIWGGIIFALIVLGIMGSAGGSSSTPKGKPAVGTDACLEAQLDHPTPNGDRVPRSQYEVDKHFSELGSLCE